MSVEKRSKKIRLYGLMALVGAALICAFCFSCANHSSNLTNGSSGPYVPAGYTAASAMTQTQIAAASDNPITINPTTKNLTITGAAGKKIYMARTNPRASTLDKSNTRLAQFVTDISASAGKSVANVQDFSSLGINGLFSAPKDPRRILDEKLEEFMKKACASNARSVSKSAANEQTSGPQTFNVGDETEFWWLKFTPIKDSDGNIIDIAHNFEHRQFKLLVSESDYYVWVAKDDQYYTADTGKFETEAQKLGTSFINGYGLVSHIYGSPADKLYNGNGSVYGPMSTKSRTGLKINIMLYDMLTSGRVYGFVFHGDVYHSIEGSNEGRFVYIDSQTTLKQPLEAYSTAMHEFSHTISKNEKSLHGKDWTYWYGELLAMLCEDMMQGYLGIDDSEVDGNLSCTPKARLPQANSQQNKIGDTWIFYNNGLSGEDTLAYASVFQFGAWLSRNFGGVKLIKELAQNAYVDMESIVKAVNAVNGTNYDASALLRKYSEALLPETSDFSLNKDAPRYTGNSDYTCAYTDANGQQQTYDYHITAINLWDYFYGWCNLISENISDICVNQSINFSELPTANIYKRRTWQNGAPTTAYLGPFMLKSGAIAANVGPYGALPICLGTAASDTVKISFHCYGGEYFGDEITIWTK